MTKRFVPILTLLLLLFGGCESNEPQLSAAPQETEPSDHQTIEESSPSDVIGGPIALSYETGDIILVDGSRVSVEDFSEINTSNPPMAVIAGLNDNGKAIGVGVHRSGTTLQWAPEGTPGNTIKFSDTVCIQDGPATFHGITLGGNTWSVICSVDDTGTWNAEENYPAFHFVNTYAETFGITGEYAFDWYMPSIAELCTIYENREATNASLQKIHGLNSAAAMDSLGTNWYWASSQSDSEDDYAWFVHYFNGYAGECPKSFDNLHVLAIHEF